MTLFFQIDFFLVMVFTRCCYFSLRTTNCESKFNQTKTITLVTATVNQILLALRVDPLKEYHVVNHRKLVKKIKIFNATFYDHSSSPIPGNNYLPIM